MFLHVLPICEFPLYILDGLNNLYICNWQKMNEQTWLVYVLTKENWLSLWIFKRPKWQLSLLDSLFNSVCSRLGDAVTIIPWLHKMPRQHRFYSRWCPPPTELSLHGLPGFYLPYFHVWNTALSYQLPLYSTLFFSFSINIVSTLPFKVTNGIIMTWPDNIFKQLKTPPNQITMNHVLCCTGSMAHEISTGTILCMGSANESKRYYITPALIDRAHTQNNPWFNTQWNHGPFCAWHFYVLAAVNQSK